MFDPKKQLFTRRAFFLGGAQSALGVGLLGRLYWLQVESEEHYKILSDKNRLHSEFLSPPRGQIRDVKGRLLTSTRFVYRALLKRDETKEWKDSLQKTVKFLAFSEEQIQSILEETKRKSKFIPIVIKNPLTWEEVATLELHAASLPGILVEQGGERSYLFGKDFCHLLGYVGKPSMTDIETANEPFLQNPHCRIGKAGLEKMHEKSLCGVPGIRQVEVNATRQVVQEVSVHPPLPGKDLTLSINLDLQQRVNEHLSYFESASAVVMDIRSGGVLAACSIPVFDTNHFVGSIPVSLWNALRNDKYSPLVAKFVQGQYSPGSTFKMVVALAGLQTKAVNGRTTFHCPGYYDYSGHRFHCHLKGGHGHVNMRQALSVSCDVYFYHLSLLTGAEAIAEVARQFGLGEKTLPQFPGEKKGLIPTRGWKEKLLGKRWTPAETITMSIGQGYVLATPIQLCVMTARFASLGKAVSPSVTKAEKHTFEQMNFDPAHLELIFSGMKDVMTHPNGTGYKSRSPLPGIDFAGKTGTAQVRRISKHERESGLHRNWPWHWRDHALFVGFAPTDAPHIAVSVVIEHGGSGSKVAAPIGRDILVDALKLCGS